jgi:uncharacterized protein YndB with AHSA1/START domain
MISYHFTSEWRFNTSANRIWNAVKDVEAIPDWWPGIKRVKIKGNYKTVEKGSVIEVIVKGLLGDFNLTFEIIWIELWKEARFKSSGDLDGFALWTLEEEEESTKARLIWDVTTTGRLLNFLGLFLKPLLAWNHNRVMNAGYQALKNRIES